MLASKEKKMGRDNVSEYRKKDGQRQCQRVKKKRWVVPLSVSKQKKKKNNKKN